MRSVVDEESRLPQVNRSDWWKTRFFTPTVFRMTFSEGSNQCHPEAIYFAEGSRFQKGGLLTFGK